jgi:hypothetical protein
MNDTIEHQMEIKYFTSPWCQMCRLQEKLVDEIKLFAQWQLEKVDVDTPDGYKIAIENGIQETPTLLFKDEHDTFKMVKNINVDLAKQLISGWTKSLEAEIIEDDVKTEEWLSWEGQTTV